MRRMRKTGLILMPCEAMRTDHLNTLEKCAVLELSSTKVSDGTDGEEWRENAGA